MINGMKLPDGEVHLKTVPFTAQVTVPVGGTRTAVDVGACVGVWTSQLTQYRRVVAFEPAPENYRCLVENAPKAECHNIALGAVPSWGSLHNPEPTNCGAWEVRPGNDVDVRTLDSFKLNDVDLLKIDVQGMETAVLIGAMNTIMLSWPTIVVEWLLNGQPNITLLHLLRDIGYRVEQAAGKDLILRR